MATPSSHGLAPLRALLLALPLLSLLLLLHLHLPPRHRRTPPPPPPPSPLPLILHTPPLRTTTQQRAAKAGSLPSSPSPTTLSHGVFGVASSRRTLPLRLPLLRLWLRPPRTRLPFLDAPIPSRASAAASLPANLHLRVSRDASRFPYTHPRGLPSAVRVARIAKELLLELQRQSPPPAPPRWLVLGDDESAFVLPNLLHTLSKYDWSEPWYPRARIPPDRPSWGYIWTPKSTSTYSFSVTAPP